MVAVAATRSSSPLRIFLLPKLLEAFPGNAAAFGINPSMLLALLVWNDGLRPDSTLHALASEPRYVRLGISCSLSAARMKTARRRARAQKLSVNAYLEALIAAHLARRGPLVILNIKSP